MGALFDGFDNKNKGGGQWRKSDGCHLRPCDTGGNSSEASTASGPHVALAGAVIRRGCVGGVGGCGGRGREVAQSLYSSCSSRGRPRLLQARAERTQGKDALNSCHKE